MGLGFSNKEQRPGFGGSMEYCGLYLDNGKENGNYYLGFRV